MLACKETQESCWNLKMAPWNRRFQLETIPIFWETMLNLGVHHIISHISLTVYYIAYHRQPSIYLFTFYLLYLSIYQSMYISIHLSFKTMLKPKIQKCCFFWVSPQKDQDINPCFSPITKSFFSSEALVTLCSNLCNFQAWWDDPNQGWNPTTPRKKHQ